MWEWRDALGIEREPGPTADSGSGLDTWHANSRPRENYSTRYLLLQLANKQERATTGRDNENVTSSLLVWSPAPGGDQKMEVPFL